MQNLKAMFLPFKSINGNLMKILAVMQLIIFLAFWWLSPNKTIPSPIETIKAWNLLALGSGLLPELFSSVKTIWIALGISSVISMLFMYASTANFFKPIANAASGLRFLGFAGLTYLFTIWTSGATELKLGLLVFGMTVFLVTSLLGENDTIRQNEIDYVRTLKIRGWRVTWEVVVLGRIDRVLDAIRQNAAMGWTLLSMVEGLTRSQGGIGAMLLNQDRHLVLSNIFAIQLTILTYGILQDIFLQYLKKILCPYAEVAKK
jgi:NitT/TauT family transport system permease protein